MPSTIINIQSGYSCAKSYHVDPTMPADLRSLGGVHDVEWKSFCDLVNKRLEPLNKLQRIFQICSALVFVGFAAFMAVVTVRITSSVWNDDSFADDGGIGVSVSSDIKNILLLMLIPLALTVGMIGVSCYISKESQKVYKGINDICVDASARNRNVSYHFRNIIERTGYSPASQTDTHDRKIFIEVVFSSDQEMNVVQATSMTPETRLQKLEEMKHLLSAQEYDDKRSSILAAV
jgi:hypothetical protein